MCLRSYFHESGLQVVYSGQIAFPHDDHAPALAPQALADLLVPGNVRGKFPFPEINTRFRSVRIPAALMPVPEAAMHKNHCPVLWQNNVGPAKHTVPRAKPEAEAESVKQGTYQLFRSRIPRANTGHIPASTLLTQPVHDLSQRSKSQTMPAISLAIKGGTALPTWVYWAVRWPQNR